MGTGLCPTMLEMPVFGLGKISYISLENREYFQGKLRENNFFFISASLFNVKFVLIDL